MSQVIVVGKEMIRISPKNTRHIEYSYNGGFKDLQIVDNEIIALTSKGMFYSKTQGRTWLFRSK